MYKHMVSAKNKYSGMHKSGMPMRIVELIHSGEKLTTSQMASRFGVSRDTIITSLVNLRRRGFTFNSVGSKTGISKRGAFGNKFKHNEGVIVDITKDENHFKETQGKYQGQIMGRAVNELRATEIAFTNYPELRGEIISSVQKALVKFLTLNESIKQIDKK